MLLVAERLAVRVTGALGQAGVPCFLLKGLAAARALYDDPLDRPFGDIDVFVPWPRLRQARAVLRAAGLDETVYGSSHASVFRGRGFGPDVDLQGWVGFPLVPRGGFEAIARAVVPYPSPFGALPLPDAATLACVSALFAVRERLRPGASALLSDVAAGRARVGDAALRARAAELGLARVLAICVDALSGHRSRWIDAIELLDALSPKVMSAAPALLVSPAWLASASFTLGAASLTRDYLLRAREGR